MKINRLIAILALTATLFSASGCEALKKSGGHVTPDVPDTGDETPEATPTIYYFSASSSSGSFHLEGCSYIADIKEIHLKTTEDAQYLLNAGYEPCTRCFPPAVEPEPEEPEEPSVPKDQATFLLNEKNGKIHHVDCYIINEMDEENKRYTDLSLEELLEEDYAPCGHCMPEQYEQYKKDHPELFPTDD